MDQNGRMKNEGMLGVEIVYNICIVNDTYYNIKYILFGSGLPEQIRLRLHACFGLVKKFTFSYINI